MTYIPTELIIEGIEHPTVIAYFQTLNQGNYLATAELFALEGSLIPPFDTPVTGREAIANYLTQEARDLQLYPKTGTSQSLPDNYQQIRVTGQVQALLFRVNVAWEFNLTPRGEIQQVEVKLLASLQELFSLKQLQA